MSTKDQQRVLRVLDNIKRAVEQDEDEACMYAPELEAMLNEMLGNDAFGTEGSTDPRGDMRNGNWSMDRVEGIDESDE
jgi:hypothetical protein